MRLLNILLLAMIAAGAGCWKKIEYKPHAASGSKSTPDHPPLANATTEKVATATPKPPNADPASNGATSTSETSSSPQNILPALPKPEDDRYAASPSQPAVAGNIGNPSSPATATEPPAQPSSGTIQSAEPIAVRPTLPSDSSVAAQQRPKQNNDDRYATTDTTPNASPPSATELTKTEKASVANLDATHLPSRSAAVAPAAPSNADTNSQPSAPASLQPKASATNSRHAAWILGSRLSLAALANDRQLAVKNVPVWFADAQSAAKSLNTSIPNLPPPAPADTDSNASKQALDYLLVNGQRIGHDLSKQRGPIESSLFEVALKSNLLLVIYRPGTPMVDSVSAALQEAAVQAKLPEKLWQPLIQAINTQAPPKEVQAAIKKLHSDVEQYLASGASPKGR